MLRNIYRNITGKAVKTRLALENGADPASAPFPSLTLLSVGTQGRPLLNGNDDDVVMVVSMRERERKGEREREREREREGGGGEKGGGHVPGCWK